MSVIFAILSIVMLVGFCKVITHGEWNKKSQRIHLLEDKDYVEEKHDNKWSDLPNNKWSDLPNDISNLILKRLSRVDFYRFGEVCTSWRQVVAESIYCKTSSPLPSMPLLLLHQLDVKNEIKAGFFSLKEQKLYHPDTPLFEGNQNCVGSIEGWLIMVGRRVWIRQPQYFILPIDNQVFFWNPISNATVMLPSKFESHQCLHRPKLLRKVVAFPRPDSPDCLAAGLFSDRLHIAFCKLDDMSWSVIPAKKDMNIVFVDIELVHGKCYALIETASHGHLNSILVYDLQVSPPQAKRHIRLQHQKLYSPYICYWTLVDGKYFHMKDYIFYYLASDPASGDLLLIFVIADFVVDFHRCENWTRFEKFFKPPKEKKFIIYKIDVSSEHPRLMKVRSLKDGIMFLSDKRNIIIPSSAICGPENLVKGNSIFSVHSYSCKECPSPGTQIAMSSMTDGKVKYIPLPDWEPDSVPTCMWFTPRVW